MKTTVFLQSLSASLLAVTVLTCAMLVHAAPPAVDPWKLLTPAEVEQVLGKLAVAPRAETIGNSVRCIYEFANGMEELEIWAAGDYSLESFRKDAKKPVTVKGLGDEAFIDRGKIDMPMVQLYVKKGTNILMLIVGEFPGDEEKLKTLAKKAVSRF